MARTGTQASRAAQTARVISLRKVAEAEARQATRAARAELEAAQRQAEQARFSLVEAEQQLIRGREAARTLDGVQSADSLARSAELLSRRAELVRTRRESALAALDFVAERAKEVERHRAEWLTCVGRREAAELHEALERRELRRARAQIERALEDETGSRAASALRSVANRLVRS